MTVKRIVSMVMLSLALLVALNSAPAQADSSPCSIPVNQQAKDGPAVKPPVELEVASQSDSILNFADGRGEKTDFIVLKASDPLSKGVTPDQFELDTLTPLRRIGEDSLESTRLKQPMRSDVRIFDHGNRVAFTLCVSANGGEPGTFNGQYLLSGPTGVSSATVTQTAQLKATLGQFLPWLIGVLLVTAVIMAIKLVSRSDDKKAKMGQVAIAVVSVVAAGIAMVLVYNGDQTWGTNTLASAAALLATGFTAAGIGSGSSTAIGKLTAALPTDDQAKPGA